MQFKHYCLISALCTGSLFANAQKEITEDFSVRYRLSSDELQKSFDNNSEELNKIIDYINFVNGCDTVSLQEVRFFGSASPEGSYKYNRSLAYQRRDSLEKAVVSKVNIPAQLIKLDDKYMDWDILAEELRKSNEPWKEKALEIIARPAKLVEFYGDLTIDARVLALIRLDLGKAWPVLRKKYFPAMRMAGMVVNTKLEPKPQPAPAPVVEEVEEVVIEEPVVEEVAVVSEAPSYVPRFTIKSNAIGWVLTQANIGFEIDICPHLSFSVPVYYSGMNYFTEKIKFRTFYTQPELRAWISKLNDGFYIGGHFGVGSYNYAFNGHTRYQDYNQDTPALGGGISIGYRLPISKNKRWKVEFSAGAGAYKVHYDKYVNEKNGPLYGTVKKTWWGLDQLAVSFSYSFPLRKGGDR